MQSLVLKTEKYAKTVSIIAFISATVFSVLFYAGRFGRDFMPSVGNLVEMVFDVAVLMVIPGFYFAKKDKWVSYAFVPIFSFWVISTVYNFLSATENITRGQQGLIIGISIFEFLIGMSMLAIGVLFIIYKTQKKRKLLWAMTILVLVVLIFFVFVFILSVTYYAVNKFTWANYFYAFRTFLSFPVGIVFTALSFFDKVINKRDNEPATELAEDDEPFWLDIEKKGSDSQLQNDSVSENNTEAETKNENFVATETREEENTEQNTNEEIDGEKNRDGIDLIGTENEKEQKSKQENGLIEEWI